MQPLDNRDNHVPILKGKELDQRVLEVTRSRIRILELQEEAIPVMAALSAKVRAELRKANPNISDSELQSLVEITYGQIITFYR